MSALHAAALCRHFTAHGIGVWIDGGWGVDALLGRQTREHGDLDIVVEEVHLAGLRALLEAQGFRKTARSDTRPWNFVLEDAEGRAVDIHVIRLDADGRGLYGPVENGQFYPPEALRGQGLIGNCPVRCVTPEYQIANRTGYALRDSDRHDLLLLSEAFTLDLPPGHKASHG